MNLLKGYCKTLGQYLNTPKGRHDSFDDIRALVIICGTVAAASILVWFLSEQL